MKVLSVGEMVIDFLPGDSEGVYIRKAGGAPANVAIALARQCCEAGFCGMMGNDDFGRFLLKTLTDNGVTPLVTELTDIATTTMAFVTLHGKGERSFTFARKPGADMFLNKEHLNHKWFDEAGIIHAGSCSLSKGDAKEATSYALEEGHRQGKLISFDVNYRDLLWDCDRVAASRAVEAVLPNVDFLKLSEEEVGMFCSEETLPKFMRDNHISVAVETLGANGARCFWNGGIYEVPGLKKTRVDTTGAGDAFWGGFIAALVKAGVNSTADINKEVLLNALRRGNISGWLCVQKKGAVEALPTAAEVQRYMEEFYQ